MIGRNHETGLQERLIRLLEENAILRGSLDETSCGRELVRQQDEFTLLHEVSGRIVSELDLQKVFDLVAINAKTIVDAELLVIPMLDEAKGHYTYVAAVGPDANEILNSTFPVHVGMCGWVLRNERSLLFGEASKCWIDEKTQWEEGQQSAVLVPLFGRKGIIGGLSALGKRGGGSFSHHDLDLLTMFASLVSTAIENAKLFSSLSNEIEERKKAEDVIAQALKEKEILLAEVHHRVKNNMAVISSLLHMKAMLADDKPVKLMLTECKQRVQSMALIHEKLYKSKNFCDIDLGEYVSELIADLKHSYGRDNVRISLDIDDINLGFNSLIPFGLIVNEILSNAFKHAFENIPEPIISVEVKQLDGTARLTISDNGCGFDPDTARRTKKTLGLNIIDALCAQLKATMDMKTGGGVSYIIIIPIVES